MPRKKKSGDAAWTDPDDAPPLTEAFFDRAEIRQGDTMIRRGRTTGAGAKNSAPYKTD